MNDYIDRQAAIDAVMILPQKWDGMYIQDLNCRLRDALNALPSAEVEPVTRCKDCIYYRQEIDMCDEPYSTAHNVVHEDDYCSRAERKEHDID